MKNYYLNINNRIKGPFMLDDLKYQAINSDTLIREGEQGQWIPISEDEDLSFLIKVQTDYTITDHNEREPEEIESQPKKLKLPIIMAIIMLLIGIGISVFMFLGPISK